MYFIIAYNPIVRVYYIYIDAKSQNPKLQQENKVACHINRGALYFPPETLRSQNGVSLYFQYREEKREKLRAHKQCVCERSNVFAE